MREADDERAEFPGIVIDSDFHLLQKCVCLSVNGIVSTVERKRPVELETVLLTNKAC